MEAGSAQEVLITLRNVGVRFFVRSQPTRWPLGRRQEFWALRDVSFDVRKGDIVGIIGRNGSGKTTCARVMTGVYLPSAGSIERKRKVTLLTLGTGFNPDLTGRQNIYINSAYLGFTPKDVREHESEIIAFSGIGEFIDRPFKTYSQGMRARLGFAVASHMEPQILILDEVLSTGDRFFREKAKRRVLEIMDAADAVVIISHQERILHELCTKLVWLEGGRVQAIGDCGPVLSQYADAADLA